MATANANRLLLTSPQQAKVTMPAANNNVLLTYPQQAKVTMPAANPQQAKVTMTTVNANRLLLTSPQQANVTMPPANNNVLVTYPQQSKVTYPQKAKVIMTTANDNSVLLTYPQQAKITKPTANNNVLLTCPQQAKVTLPTTRVLLNYSDVNGLDKTALNQQCRKEGIPCAYPQQAKVNLLCLALGISTSGSDKENISPRWNPGSLSKQQLREYASLTPDFLAKLNDWSKSIKDAPDINDITVKQYLLNTNVIPSEMSKTYKVSKPYKMQQFVHSMRYHKLPNHPAFTALQAQCNPSQTASNDSVKLLFVILHCESGDPVGGYCTCTAGRSQSCAHIGAALFCMAGLVASGKTQLPTDPSCTDVPCAWTGNKGKNISNCLGASRYRNPSPC